MPPKSKLTDKQWHEIIKRKLAGEETRPLAREFGVSDTAIHKRVGLQCKQIKEAAECLVTAERKLSEIPVGLQIETLNYASGLRAMSGNMLESAIDSSATSKKLARMARVCMDKLKDDPGEEDMEGHLLTLKAVDYMQTTANKANVIPMNLLLANKDNAGRLLDIPKSKENQEKTIIPNDPLEASRSYQRMIEGK